MHQNVATDVTAAKTVKVKDAPTMQKAMSVVRSVLLPAVRKRE